MTSAWVKNLLTKWWFCVIFFMVYWQSIAVSPMNLSTWYYVKSRIMTSILMGLKKESLNITTRTFLKQKIVLTLWILPASSWRWTPEIISPDLIWLLFVTVRNCSSKNIIPRHTGKKCAWNTRSTNCQKLAVVNFPGPAWYSRIRSSRAIWADCYKESNFY